MRNHRAKQAGIDAKKALEGAERDLVKQNSTLKQGLKPSERDRRLQLTLTASKCI